MKIDERSRDKLGVVYALRLTPLHSRRLARRKHHFIFVRYSANDRDGTTLAVTRAFKASLVYMQTVLSSRVIKKKYLAIYFTIYLA